MIDLEFEIIPKDELPYRIVLTKEDGTKAYGNGTTGNNALIALERISKRDFTKHYHNFISDINGNKVCMLCGLPKNILNDMIDFLEQGN
jgi:hypothetical protein